MMLLPTIHTPQALCSHPYPDPTRLVSRGDTWLGGQRLWGVL